MTLSKWVFCISNVTRGASSSGILIKVVSYFTVLEQAKGNMVPNKKKQYGKRLLKTVTYFLDSWLNEAAKMKLVFKNWVLPVYQITIIYIIATKIISIITIIN